MKEITSISEGPLPVSVLQQIQEAARGLAFGTIEIIFQDSRVVQIERREKFRLKPAGTPTGSPGGQNH